MQQHFKPVVEIKYIGVADAISFLGDTLQQIQTTRIGRWIVLREGYHTLQFMIDSHGKAVFKPDLDNKTLLGFPIEVHHKEDLPKHWPKGSLWFWENPFDPESEVIAVKGF